MANMSYCRFHNTCIDMEDCIDALVDGDALSEDELTACKNMFTDVLEFFEDYDICEVEWDEFNKWIDAIDRR